MMEKSSNLLNEIYSLSDFNAKYKFEFDYLCTENICMVDCSYEIRGKTVQYKYNLERLNKIHNLKYEFILRLLINLIQLKKHYKDYLVEINLDNLYVDLNLIPKFLKRDVLYQKKDYLKDILVLAFYLIDQKKDFNYYEVSGFFTEYKSKLLNKIKVMEYDEDVLEALWEAYEIFISI